jgi:hypothetical protein
MADSFLAANCAGRFTIRFVFSEALPESDMIGIWMSLQCLNTAVNGISLLRRHSRRLPHRWQQFDERHQSPWQLA